MAPTEAMRLYVRTLEEENPGWLSDEVMAEFEAEAGSSIPKTDQEGELNNHDQGYDLKEGTSEFEERSSAHQSQDLDQKSTPPFKSQTAAEGGSQFAEPRFRSRSVAEVVVEGSWVSPYIASKRQPPPRYEQAVALCGNLIYIVGGSAAGRHLSDTWALNLENLTWDQVAAGGPGAPALAGHAAVSWNGNLLIIGGRAKATDKGQPLEDSMAVRLLDTSAGAWSMLDTKGLSKGLPPNDHRDAGEPQGTNRKNRASNMLATVPGPRGAHTATLMNGKVYVFGGEDAKRRPLSEFWTLDLATLEWDMPVTEGAQPSARSGHSALAFRNRYILIFGGGTVANCFNDLVVLDTQTMEWIVPETEGSIPPPRAGHAAAILGTTLYIVGGGNNVKGCADMYSLELSNLGNGILTWNLVGNTPPEAAIASEGLSLVTVPMAGCMVSFGGYNGKYHNAIHVYRPEGFVVVRPGTSAAETSNQEDANSFGRDTEEEEGGGGETARDQEKEIDYGKKREEKNQDESSALELSLMRRQLDSANAALAAAESTAAEAREALSAEQQRSMRLEVEVAELKQKLLEMKELEKELARRQKTDNQKSGGLWSFISGADSATADVKG